MLETIPNYRIVTNSPQAWRVLTRSYMAPAERGTLLAYTPMLHSRLFQATARFRDSHFQPTREGLEQIDSTPRDPWLDGNPATDRPLIVQFCANDPNELLQAARYVEPYCDAVDLNLGCPQAIARSGRYGAFLQEDWDLIYRLINKLHTELSIPVTAKFRILESKERTLEYAKMILSAGASILTVHGRRRDQKGHSMGLADWSYIRYLRDNLPPDTVIFANGNVLNRHDLQPCLDATGADGVMSAEGNLSDPTIFAEVPAPEEQVDEYWRDKNGIEGYRLDGVLRRYLDTVHRNVLGEDPPNRPRLFLPTDLPDYVSHLPYEKAVQGSTKLDKKTRRARSGSPNLRPMQGHLFQMLRPMINTYTDIREVLAKSPTGDIAAFERVLSMVEDAVKVAIIEYTASASNSTVHAPTSPNSDQARDNPKYKRPWWICQPYLRPPPPKPVDSESPDEGKKRLGDPADLVAG